MGALVSATNLDNDPGGSAQIMDEPEVDMRVTRRGRLDNVHADRRLVDVIGKFQSNAKARRTERETHVGTEAEVKRELRFNTEFVNGNQ